MKKTVVVIPATGPIRTQEIDGSLQAAQAIVGGYIEPVMSREGLMFVNEEGMLRGLPVNTTASLLCGRPIVGDVYIDRPKKALLAQIAAELADK
jgi:hypothetical protein